MKVSTVAETVKKAAIEAVRSQNEEVVAEAQQKEVEKSAVVPEQIKAVVVDEATVLETVPQVLAVENVVLPEPGVKNVVEVLESVVVPASEVVVVAPVETVAVSEPEVKSIVAPPAENVVVPEAELKNVVPAAIVKEVVPAVEVVENVVHEQPLEAAKQIDPVAEVKPEPVVDVQSNVDTVRSVDAVETVKSEAVVNLPNAEVSSVQQVENTKVDASEPEVRQAPAQTPAAGPPSIGAALTGVVTQLTSFFRPQNSQQQADKPSEASEPQLNTEELASNAAAALVPSSTAAPSFIQSALNSITNFSNILQRTTTASPSTEPSAASGTRTSSSDDASVEVVQNIDIVEDDLSKKLPAAAVAA